MKKILTLLVLLTHLCVNSQNLFEKIKNDTVYMFFDHLKYQSFNKTVWHIKDSTMNNPFEDYREYVFKIDGLNYISFRYSRYLDFDSFENGKKMDVQIVKKNFLKKNKDRIIDIDFMLNNGLRETFFALYDRKKKVYIIDSEEIKCRKVTLREVVMDSPYFIE